MKNEGTLDRMLRVILGLGLLRLTVIGPITAWGYVRLIPLLTGVLGVCPLYKLFCLSTCPLSSK